jgi:putative addiction module component (TIGR02574 family)
MDPAIASVFHLSPADKLQLVQDLWDDLAAAPANVPVHDWQIAELDRRRQRLLSDPTSAIPWDEFDRQLRERYGH